MVAKAIFSAFETLGIAVFKVVKTGVTWAWDTFAYVSATFLDDLTPFIPLPPFVKLNILLLFGVLYVGLVFGFDEVLVLIWELFSVILKGVVQLGTESVHLLYSILAGESKG